MGKSQSHCLRCVCVCTCVHMSACVCVCARMCVLLLIRNSNSQCFCGSALLQKSQNKFGFFPRFENFLVFVLFCLLFISNHLGVSSQSSKIRTKAVRRYLQSKSKPVVYSIPLTKVMSRNLDNHTVLSPVPYILPFQIFASALWHHLVNETQREEAKLS